MAKLKQDYIDWVLTLNASQLQKEMHNVTEANRELEKSNKSIRDEMNRLRADGKKNTALKTVWVQVVFEPFNW